MKVWYIAFIILYTYLVVSLIEMPKRKLEDELEEDWADTGTKIKQTNKKNSLDSDEEDDGEEKTYDILAEDEIEGENLDFEFSKLNIFQYELDTLRDYYISTSIVNCHSDSFVFIYDQVKKREQLVLMVK